MAKDDGRVHKRIRMRRKDLLESNKSYLKPLVVKDIDVFELEVKRAYQDSNNASEATGKVMNIVKTNFIKYLDALIDGPKETLLNRILELKSQIKNGK